MGEICGRRRQYSWNSNSCLQRGGVRNMNQLHVSLITGVSLGLEYVEEDNVWLLDFFFVRFVLFLDPS